MKEVIVSIISAVFSIITIILNAAGLTNVGEVFELILPYVNIIAVSVLFFFGYSTTKELATLKSK